MNWPEVASESRVGGMLAGKVNCQYSCRRQQRAIKTVYIKVIEHADLPAAAIYPTHMNRHINCSTQVLTDESRREYPISHEPPTVFRSRRNSRRGALAYCLRNKEWNIKSIDMSSDRQMPVYRVWWKWGLGRIEVRQSKQSFIHSFKQAIFFNYQVLWIALASISASPANILKAKKQRLPAGRYDADLGHSSSKTDLTIDKSVCPWADWWSIRAQAVL